MSKAKKLLRDLSALFSPSTARRVRWAIAGSIVAAIAEMVGLAVILPLVQMLSGASTDTGLLGRLSDIFGNPSDDTLAMILAAIVFLAFLSKGIFNLVFRWWMLGFLQHQSATTSTELLRCYVAAPYALHLKRNSANLLRTMGQSVNQAYSNVVLGLISALTEVATIIAIVGVLIVLKPITTIAAVVYFGLAGYGFNRLVKRGARRAGERLNETAFLTFRSSFHALGGIKEVKVRRNAKHFIHEYDIARQGQASATRTVLFLGEAPKYVLEIVFIVGVALMTVMAYSGSTSENAIAELALFVAAGFRVLPSMVRVLAASTSIRSGLPGLDLVLADFKTLETVDVSSVDSVSSPPLDLESSLHIEGLSYRYETSESDVLHNVSIAIPAGESIAIVGPSGAGKSTLIDILLGLHTPTEGRVLADGIDVATELSRWQRSIGVVPQDVYLLDASLRANIAFGEDEANIDEGRIAEAVSLAQLDELIAELPEGLDTFVGERGVRLSGGQRQRIGIARALYIKPQLLVLDEATSALDNETERKITSTIESLHGSLTIVVVAHRLSTVRRCDQLIFLEDGEVAAQGTFDEVRAANADFASLVELANLDRAHAKAEAEDAEDSNAIDPTTGIAI